MLTDAQCLSMQTKQVAAKESKVFADGAKNAATGVSTCS